MFGYVLLVVPVTALELPPAALPQRPYDGDFTSGERDQITEALKGTPLAGFSVANNTSHDNHVRLAGDEFHLRVALFLDPRSGEMRGKRAKFAELASAVNVRCWVSVNRATSGRLTCGTWNDGEEHAVGVEITNDPSKDDPNRMHVFVIAPDMFRAQDALLQTLRGEKRPEKPWII